MSRKRRSSLVMGRIHISPWIKEDHEERLIALTNSRIEYEQFKKEEVEYIWVFGDQLIKTIDNEKIIFARLGKIKRGFEDTIYDKEKGSFNRIIAKSPRTLAYSNLIIYPKRHLILFEERIPDISINQVIKSFSEIYKQQFPDLSNVGIDLIIEARETLDILRKYDKIIETKFKLIPSNPTDEPEFRKLDELLKKGNTEEATFKFTNKKEGLKIKGSILEEGLFMVGAGYGEYDITVERKGSKEKIKSKDKILREVIESTDEREELLKDFWEKMKKHIKQRDQT